MQTQFVTTPPPLLYFTLQVLALGAGGALGMQYGTVSEGRVAANGVWFSPLNPGNFKRAVRSFNLNPNVVRCIVR